MTTHNQSSNPLAFGKFGNLFFARQAPVLDAKTHTGIFAGLFGEISAWRSRRAAAAELARLSDRELADIGLTRQDISQVVARKM